MSESPHTPEELISLDRGLTDEEVSRVIAGLGGLSRVETSHFLNLEQLDCVAVDPAERSPQQQRDFEAWPH